MARSLPYTRMFVASNPLIQDDAYLELAQTVLRYGNHRIDRTGTGITTCNSLSMVFDVSERFPLLTTKFVAFRVMIAELLWMLRGETNIRPLVLNNVHIWNEWPFQEWLIATGVPIPKQGSGEWDEHMSDFVSRIKDDEEFAAMHGELGPVYGHQWRNWGAGAYSSGVDQIKNVIHSLRTTPHARDHIVDARNAQEWQWLRQYSLPPCHMMYQVFVNDDYLDLQIYQRSADVFLGVPFNIASYAALMHIIGHFTGLKPGVLTWLGGDVHIYDNHREQVLEQLSRTPLESPRLITSIDSSIADPGDLSEAMFSLKDYVHHPAIRGQVAV